MTRDEGDLTDAWLDEHDSEYEDVELEFPLGYEGTRGSRKADIVAFVTDDEVDVFEVKRYLDPRGFGQCLWYAQAVEDTRNLTVRRKGIIFAKETDGLTRALAEDHDIELIQV